MEKDVEICDNMQKRFYKSVKFSKQLQTIYYLDSFQESKEDRKGLWCQEALDRHRFEDRIRKLSKVILPILLPMHRNKFRPKH